MRVTRLRFSLRSLMYFVTTISVLCVCFVMWFLPPSQIELQRERTQRWAQHVKWLPDKTMSIEVNIDDTFCIISTAPLIVTNDTACWDGGQTLPEGYFMAYPPGRKVKGIDAAFDTIVKELRKKGRP
jgi:hypothetical protein